MMNDEEEKACYVNNVVSESFVFVSVESTKNCSRKKWCWLNIYVTHQVETNVGNKQKKREEEDLKQLLVYFFQSSESFVYFVSWILEISREICATHGEISRIEYT